MVKTVGACLAFVIANMARAQAGRFAWSVNTWAHFVNGGTWLSTLIYCRFETSQSTHAVFAKQTNLQRSSPLRTLLSP